jgi:hypothetical protein
MKDHRPLFWHGLTPTKTAANPAPVSGNHPAPHAALSRRHFVALSVASGLGTGLAHSDVSAQEYADTAEVRFDGDIDACSPAPIPVEGDPNLGGLHIWLPVPGVEPSAIFDFKGQVGVADISGMGTLTDTATGTETRLPFLADIRYMSGAYVGVDRKVHNGTFGFV